MKSAIRFAKHSAAGLFLLSSLLLLAACGDKWSAMSDLELQEKQLECLMAQDPSAVFVQICQNYARECKRRREQGNPVC